MPSLHRHVPVSFRTLLLFVLAVGTFALYGAATAPTASAAAGPIDTFEAQQLYHINKYRKKHGLPRLSFDGRLTRAANWMARDMALHGYFAHEDRLGRDPFQRLQHFKYPANTWRGENLAAGNDEARPTLQQWIDSPPHRANLLNRNYRAVGISRVCIDTSEYGCYWVTEYGSKVVARVRRR